MPTSSYLVGMLIIHVTRQFLPSIGGIESVVHALATAQIAAGHRVRIVTLNRLFKSASSHDLPARELIDGIEIIRVPFFGSTRYPLAFSAIKFIRDADIVHVHGIDFFFDYLAWTKLLHGRKLTVSTHGAFFHTQFAASLKHAYFRIFTRASLTWYDGVVAVSHADYDLFSRVRHHGLVCIENGVDITKFAHAVAPEPRKGMVSIGRFSANKRLDRLIAFFAALHRIDEQWRLIIAGRPWDLDVTQVVELAKQAEVEDAVQVLAHPSDADIRGLLAGCSVLVSASEFEGFGIAAVEGLSAGLYPLLNDIPVFRRLVQQAQVGTLLDFAQPKAAAELFSSQWGEISRKYKSLRQTAIAAAAGFDWGRTSDAYMSVYEAARGTRTRRILDVSLPVWKRTTAVAELDQHFERDSNTLVAFANANCLNVAQSDSRVRSALGEALVLNDGVGIDIASRLLFGAQFPDNLNGTDFTPYYLQNTRHRFRLYLLGGRPGIAEKAAQRLSQICPEHSIVGCQGGYFPRADDPLVVQAMRAARADVLLVAMGNPDQELWLRNNLAATGCRMGFAVGALFDFMAGQVQRAPPWARAVRVEWVYRLAHEPRRLWRRYVLGNPLFLARVLGQWWSGARV
jgi:alpha-1,3-mannosyltransferase